MHNPLVFLCNKFVFEYLAFDLGLIEYEIFHLALLEVAIRELVKNSDYIAFTFRMKQLKKASLYQHRKNVVSKMRDLKFDISLDALAKYLIECKENYNKDMKNKGYPGIGK